MATSAKSSKKSDGGGGINAKIILAALGIAAISSLSSFVAIRLAMPAQVIIEKHVEVEKPKGAHGEGDGKHEELPGPTYAAGEFVVNLTDAGRHYLKTNVVLQYVQQEAHAAEGGKKEEKKAEGGGHGGGGEAEAADPMKAEMAPYEPILRDTVISTLARQSIARLKTPGGMDLVKDELKVALNKAIPQKKVMRVFFTDFVIQ